MNFSVSIIIPVLNEVDTIAATIASARMSGQCEIVVVDGGSTDGTVANAQQADHVVHSAPGRAKQQNLGAEKSSGDILLFLHADCELPVGAIESIQRQLHDTTFIGGCFNQAIDAQGRRFRWLESGNALRVKLLKVAYGDQGIFVRRETFQAIGGFPQVKLMEDLMLMKTLKKQGGFAILDDRLTVSARRWQRQGVVRQTLRNWSLVTLTQLGVSPNRLAKFYPQVR